MHGAAVVPHDQVPDAPTVRVTKLPLCGVLHQHLEQVPGLLLRQPFDVSDVGREVQGFTIILGKLSHQRPAYRRESVDLLRGEILDAHLAARMQDGVLAPQAAEWMGEILGWNETRKRDELARYVQETGIHKA